MVENRTVEDSADFNVQSVFESVFAEVDTEVYGVEYISEREIFNMSENIAEAEGNGLAAFLDGRNKVDNRGDDGIFGNKFGSV